MDEGMLQALADGELSGDDRRAAERHLDACVACQAELEFLRSASGEFAGALSLLDRPAPGIRGSAPAAPRRRPAPRAWGGSWGLARAAMLVLGFAAAASATIPGSPVREWLGQLVRPETEVAVVSEPRATTDAPRPEATAAAVEAAPEAGISVLPTRGGVRIVLREASPDLQVHAVLVDQPRAGVFARGEAASARFTTGPGRIEVEGVGPGELRIELPRNAYNATVVVNGKQYLTKEGDRMRLSVPAQHATAHEVSFKVQP